MAQIQPFGRIRTENKELIALQNSLARIFNELLKPEVLAGRLITGVSLSTETTTVSHGLGRELRGWHVVDKNDDESIWRVNATTRPARELQLKASGTVSVNLWVF